MQVLSQIHGVASKNKSWLLPYLTLVPRISPSNPLRISPRETFAKVGVCRAQSLYIAVLIAPCGLLCDHRFLLQFYNALVKCGNYLSTLNAL
jgi:hypothetical protein